MRIPISTIYAFDVVLYICTLLLRLLINQCDLGLDASLVAKYIYFYVYCMYIVHNIIVMLIGKHNFKNHSVYVDI